MRIIIVDDEVGALTYMENMLKAVRPDAEITKCDNPDTAQALFELNRYDVAILDINMGGENNGIDLARHINKIRPKTNIVFVTGYTDYYGDAFGVDASAYLSKPVGEENLRHALDTLRYSTDQGSEKRIRITCFGNFAVCVDGRPVSFAMSKAKEMLAYLIDRKGAAVTNEELAGILFEDNHHESYFRKIRLSLIDTFKSYGIENLIFSSRGNTGISNMEMIECDYYKYLSGQCDQSDQFVGEYMSQYPWADYTRVMLEKNKKAEAPKIFRYD